MSMTMIHSMTDPARRGAVGRRAWPVGPALIALLLAGVAVLLAGCGDDDRKGGASPAERNGERSPRQEGGPGEVRDPEAALSPVDETGLGLGPWEGPERTFQSELPLEVAYLPRNRSFYLVDVGMTPAAKPLALPADRLWYVRPVKPVDASVLADELVAKDVSGLELGVGYGLDGKRLDFEITDADMVHLGRVIGLHLLVVDGSKLTDAGLAPLKDLTQLRKLDLTSAKGITDAGLACLQGMKQLRVLRLRLTGINGSGLAHLPAPEQLTNLDLMMAKVTDAGLASLEPMTGLRELDLMDTDITDRALAHMKGLTELRRLNLRGTKVTDAGLVHLHGLGNLQRVDLKGTQVTDAGLVHLYGLGNLQRVDLRGTRVTEAGAAALREALPQAEVRHGSEWE